ncbi:hypothetical protein [Campylobacter concisus]|uniref:Uncharacterized protein n=1 Tax=Campylobacter concisus TaxID=199 RepID=A0A7S9S8M8_9BACT|nr:hypothetical protein [Campylobacter concisus]QPH98480.1 hypothetical protein CVS89_09570 [Campylobacter concisus]QPI05663.1 hypothetical protein G5B99_09355 [Campylobacter concisus]
MAVKVGVIKNILGSKEVVVIDKNGNERVVVAGDSLYEGDVVKANGAKVTIASNDGKEFELKDGETLNLNNDLSSDKEVAAIQKALLKGENLANLEESAAGGNSGGRGGDGVSLGETRFEHGGHESSDVSASFRSLSDTFGAVKLTNQEVKGGGSDVFDGSDSDINSAIAPVAPVEPSQPENPTPQPKPVEPVEPKPEPTPEPQPEPKPDESKDIVKNISVENKSEFGYEKSSDDKSYLEYNLKGEVAQADADKKVDVTLKFGGEATTGKDYENAEYSLDGGKTWQKLDDSGVIKDVRAGDINKVSVRVEVTNDHDQNEGTLDPSEKIFTDADKGVENNGYFKESVSLEVSIGDNKATKNSYIVDNDHNITITSEFHNDKFFDATFKNNGNNTLNFENATISRDENKKIPSDIVFGDGEKNNGVDIINSNNSNLNWLNIKTQGGNDTININGGRHERLHVETGADNDTVNLNGGTYIGTKPYQSGFTLDSGNDVLNLNGTRDDHVKMTDMYLRTGSGEKDEINIKYTEMDSTYKNSANHIIAESKNNTINVENSNLKGINIGTETNTGTDVNRNPLNFDLNLKSSTLDDINLNTIYKTHVVVEDTKINGNYPENATKWNFADTDDTLELRSGTLNDMTVNLGNGEDKVVVSKAMKLDGYTTINGGTSYETDTLVIDGNVDFNKFKSFEELQVTGKEKVSLKLEDLYDMLDIKNGDSKHILAVTEAAGGVELAGFKLSDYARGLKEGFTRYEADFGLQDNGRSYTVKGYIDVKNGINVDLGAKPEPTPVEPVEPVNPAPAPQPEPQPEPKPEPTPDPNGKIVNDLRVETITKEVSEKPGNDSYLEYGIRANVDKANADKMLKVFFGFGGKADHGKDYDNVEYSIDGKNWELLPLKDYSATINVKAGDINNLTVRARVLDDDRLNEGKFDPTNKIYKNAEGIEGNGEYKESVTLIVEVDDTITSADEYIVDNDREVTIPIGYHSTNPFDIEFAGDGRNILKIKYGHSILGSLDQEGTNKINFGDEKLSGKDELSAESVNLIKTDINTYGGDDVINIRSSYNIKEVNVDMGAGNDVLGLSILDNSVGKIENSKFKLGSGSNTVNIGGAELKDVILDMSSDDKDAVNTINFDFGDYMNVIDKPVRFTSTTPKDVYDIDVSSAHNTLNLGWAYLDGVTIGSNRSEKGTLDIKGDVADLKGVNIESGNNETHIDIDYARINYRAPGQPDQEVKSSEWNLSPYNDTIKIDGGFINKLKVNLGAGDDNVFLSMKTNNSSLQMDGGDGYDVATVEANIGGYNNKFKGFEELRITGNEAYRIGTKNVFINDVLQDDNNHTIDVYLSKISQANGGVKLYEKYHKADGAEEGYQRYEFKNENFTDDNTGEKYTQTIHVDIKNDIHVDL